MYKYFIDRVRHHLHVIVIVSTSTVKLKRHFRHYPTLIKLCTIDWLTAWPEDAIETVSKKFIASMNFNQLKNDEKSNVENEKSQTDEFDDPNEIELNEFDMKLVKLMGDFHRDAIEASTRYLILLFLNFFPFQSNLMFRMLFCHFPNSL